MIKEFRIGFGLDSHRFIEKDKEKKLILGGVEVKGCRGLKANSDGDVLLHSLTNSLAQAIGGKSISFYADELCLRNGIKDSKAYLKKVLEEVKAKEWKVNNIGIIVECEKPKIEPIAKKIKENLAKVLGIGAERISVQATSGEKLNEVARGKGIQVYSICSLIK